MSVGLGSVLVDHDYPPEKMLELFPDYGLAYVTAGQLRTLRRADGSACPQGIMLVPTTEEPWHGVVFDQTHRPRKDAVCKAICRVADWAIPLVK